MEISENLLKKILVETDLISQKEFDLTKEKSQQNKEPLLDLIIERGLIQDEELGALIADEIKVPFINLRKQKIKKELLDIVPEVVAQKQLLIVFDRTSNGLKVAMVNPDNLEIREFIERKTGEKVIPYFVTRRDVQNAFKYYRKEIKEELEGLIGKALKDWEESQKTPQVLSLPVIKIIDLILNYGYENRASDIHLEPYRDKIIIRFRIDGVLHDVLTLPNFFHSFFVSRIKIISKLRTDVHEAAQDGRFSFGSRQEKVDVRVSIVPIEEGEKVVLRLLSERARRFNLEDLGLNENNLKIVKENIKKPWGMILVSGPTGSGKTTTLYAILKIINTREINIMTIEDPVEYDILGINQIQVNAATNLTFSEGLKAVIRQNPDIIMVGEIRDQETASLAVNASMTGHLVLSTFHANDAGTTLPRLEDMGIEPFLIASTVNIIISQRLVRKICPKCIESYEVPLSKIANFLGENLSLKILKSKKNNSQPEKIRLFRGQGCGLCQKTGYLGRIGIFEVLEMKEPIKKLVMEKANAFEIKKTAQKLGMSLMIENGLKKMEEGITTLDEVLRAAKE